MTTLAAIIAQGKMTLELADLATIGSVIAGSIVGAQALIALGDRLWFQKKQVREIDENPICQKQHQEIQQSLQNFSAETNQVIRDMAHNIDRFREAVQSSHSDLAIKQEQIMSKLSVIENEVTR